MPELPEVQTIINDLNKAILNKKIADIKISKKKLIQSNYPAFQKSLKNNSIKKISRRGKLIICKLNKSDKFLLIHLKMTGQLIYQSKSKLIAGGHSDKQSNINSLPNKQTHIIFTFQDKSKLFFNDQRQFGYMKIVDQNELENIKSQFGLEPLDKSFTLDKFKEIFKNKKGPVKGLLLNQKFLAGLGNIYVDEVLYLAKIKPTKKINKLTQKEINAIYKNIPKLLKKAIKYRGTTFSNYRDSSGKRGNFSRLLKVYKKNDTLCPRCKNVKIKKTKVAGRGTHFCPKCQK